MNRDDEHTGKMVTECASADSLQRLWLLLLLLLLLLSRRMRHDQNSCRRAPAAKKCHGAWAIGTRHKKRTENSFQFTSDIWNVTCDNMD